jgi:hypothetical protein
LPPAKEASQQLQRYAFEDLACPRGNDCELEMVAAMDRGLQGACKIISTAAKTLYLYRANLVHAVEHKNNLPGVSLENKNKNSCYIRIPILFFGTKLQ